MNFCFACAMCEDCGARGRHLCVGDGDGEGGARRVGGRLQGRNGLVGTAGRRPRRSPPQHGREHRQRLRRRVLSPGKIHVRRPQEVGDCADVICK